MSRGDSANAQRNLTPGVLAAGETLDGAAAVHIADALAHEVRPELGDGTPPPALDLAYLEQLGVTAQLDHWRDVAVSASRSLPVSAPTAAAA